MTCLSKVIKLSFSILFFAISLISLKAQELRATVKVSGDRLGSSVNQQSVSNLERQLFDLLNNTRWSTATFSLAERIECTFTLSLIEVKDDSKYKAELFITARRPVYNTAYFSPVLSHRDKEINFEYNSFDPIEYNPTDIRSNLVASIAFYANMILALDFDSFSLLGGNAARTNMRQLVAMAQSQNEWNGWKAFENNNNRYALAEALNDPEQEPFRALWYQYHRRGLDEMAMNVNRGRNTILQELTKLEEVQRARPMSPLLNMFAVIKLEELVNVLSKANTSEKQEAFRLLNKVFPTETQKLNPLKQ